MSKKRPPCLLVVENEPAVRDLIVVCLKGGGHDKIVTAGNAEEALFYIFKDAGLNIQLALVYLVLPNASGLTLIRRIREAKSAKRKTLPVAVLTGRTDTDTYQAVARRGIQAYLVKPISLVETVSKALIARGIAPLHRRSAKTLARPWRPMLRRPQAWMSWICPAKAEWLVCGNGRRGKGVCVRYADLKACTQKYGSQHD